VGLDQNIFLEWQAVEQGWEWERIIIGIICVLSLRYLGVPVFKKVYMFGDNKSVVDSLTVPHAKLYKHHNIRVGDYVGWHLVRKNFLQYYVYLRQWYLCLSDVFWMVTMPRHNTYETTL